MGDDVSSGKYDVISMKILGEEFEESTLSIIVDWEIYEEECNSLFFYFYKYWSHNLILKYKKYFIFVFPDPFFLLRTTDESINTHYVISLKSIIIIVLLIRKIQYYFR